MGAELDSHLNEPFAHKLCHKRLPAIIVVLFGLTPVQQFECLAQTKARQPISDACTLEYLTNECLGGCTETGVPCPNGTQPSPFVQAPNIGCLPPHSDNPSLVPFGAGQMSTCKPTDLRRNCDCVHETRAIWTQAELFVDIRCVISPNGIPVHSAGGRDAGGSRAGKGQRELCPMERRMYEGWYQTLFIGGGVGGLLALRPTHPKKILTQNLAEGKPNLN